MRPAHRVPLCIEIASARGAVGKLRRQLPKAPGGPGVPPADMRAAYWLEQATRALTQAEQAWDDDERRVGE